MNDMFDYIQALGRRKCRLFTFWWI